MSYVEHIRDAVVTDLVYRHLSSWHALGCYFAWREHHAREELKRLPIGKRVGQGHTRRRLTEHGWLDRRWAAQCSRDRRAAAGARAGRAA
jgi:hypothetical protein